MSLKKSRSCDIETSIPMHVKLDVHALSPNVQHIPSHDSGYILSETSIQCILCCSMFGVDVGV